MYYIGWDDFVYLIIFDIRVDVGVFDVEVDFGGGDEVEFGNMLFLFR